MLELNAKDLQSWAAEPGASLQLLDVREPWELATAALRIDGTQALDIPMMQIPLRLAELDRSRSVICICHHGARSAQVVAFLMQLGFDHAYNLAGGIEAWSTEVDPRVPRY